MSISGCLCVCECVAAPRSCKGACHCVFAHPRVSVWQRQDCVRMRVFARARVCVSVWQRQNRVRVRVIVCMRVYAFVCLCVCVCV